MGAAAICTSIGQETGRNLGMLASKTTALFLSYWTGKVVLNQENSLPIQSTKTRKLLSLTLAVLSALSIYIATIEKIQDPLEERLGYLGENLFGITGGILASFAAIRLNGSRETLLSSANPLETYTIKTLVSMTGTALFDAKFPISNPMLQFGVDLTIGSILYNFWDILDVAKKAHSGHLLDEMLYKNPIEFGLNKIPLKQPLLQICRQIHDQQLENDPLVNVILQLFLLPKERMNDLKGLQQVAQAPLTLEQRTNQAFYRFIRGINLYQAILNNVPDVLSSGTSMGEFNIRAYSVLEGQIRDVHSNSLSTAFENIPFVAFTAFTHHLLEKALRAALTHSNAYHETLVETLISKINLMEHRLCGFSITKKSEKVRIAASIHNHLPSLIKCILFCEPLTNVPLEELEMREAYKVMAHLAIEIYSPRIGAYLTTNIKRFVQHQIEHSTQRP